jgi:carbamoyl-phosphate synthase large subunit|tara:strand:- start:6 stop:1013 length:1008 start_codon:yes stop_codon:yes gene_type:complete
MYLKKRWGLMGRIKVGVTGTGSLIGQAIIKSIKSSNMSKDIYMIGFDYFDDTVGALWVEKNYLLPDFFREEVTVEDWLEEIIEIIDFEGIEILFIGIDFELELFAKYKNTIELKTKCKIVVSSQDVIKIADDKYMTYEFLKEKGFYYPQTLLPEELEKEKIDFPCFIKPRKGSRSRDAFIVMDSQQLNEALSVISSPIIQELIGNSEVEYTCGVIHLDNEVKGAITLRRELKDGNTMTASFCKDTPRIIYDYVCQVASELKPFGACNIQIRLDVNDIPKIFEINCRHSGTTYIRTLFGFNEVEYILSYLLGKKPKKFILKEGVVKRYYEEVFVGS